MRKTKEKDFWKGWQFDVASEQKLDTLIDFTIALMEEEAEDIEGDAFFHANMLGLQLGFSEAQTQHILGTIVKNYSQALMFRPN